MHYTINLTPQLKQQLQKIWSYDEQAELLDVTAFGDFFIALPNQQILFYSLTDGQINDVTELVAEFGLPPVNLDLGDEWYQLSAQALLKESKIVLPEGHCFGFKIPLFTENSTGIYGPENIQAIKIEDYHQAVLPLMAP